MTYYPLTFYQQICKNCWQVNARGKTSKMAKHINLFWMRLYGILCGFVSLFTFSGGRAKAATTTATLGACVPNSNKTNGVYVNFGLCQQMYINGTIKGGGGGVAKEIIQNSKTVDTNGYICKTVTQKIGEYNDVNSYMCLNIDNLDPRTSKYHDASGEHAIISFYEFGNGASSKLSFKLVNCVNSNEGFNNNHYVGEYVPQSSITSFYCAGCRGVPFTVTNSAFGPLMHSSKNLEKCYLHESSGGTYSGSPFQDSTGTFQYKQACAYNNTSWSNT